MALTGSGNGDAAPALGNLLLESLARWAPGAMPQCDVHAQPDILTFDRDGLPWLCVRRVDGPQPVRWLVETVLPESRTSRTRFACTSVLHVLRVVRQIADSGFDPLTRARMGAPGPAE